MSGTALYRFPAPLILLPNVQDPSASRAVWKRVHRLKNIPFLISPDLMHELLSMGHGDELVLADGNFPAASHAQRLVRDFGAEIGAFDRA